MSLPFLSSDAELSHLACAFEFVTCSYSRAFECLKQLGQERDGGKCSHACLPHNSAYTLVTAREGGRSRAGLAPPSCLCLLPSLGFTASV